MNAVGIIVRGSITSATPLLYSALGETLTQQSGVVNVGLEGMMLTGAFTATLVTLHSHSPLLGTLMAAVSGMVMALLFSLFAIVLNANQVVVGVVVNLLALGITGTLYRILFGVVGASIVTQSLPQFAGITLFGGITLFAGMTPLTPLALIATIGIWWWLCRTRPGLQLRACGEQPVAAEAAGVRVLRIRILALMFGGLMAGIGGAFLSIGDSNTFVPNLSAGRGFIALAIVTAGRWNPWGCLIASLIFGMTDALQFQGQAIGLDSLYGHLISGSHLTHFAHSLNLDHLPYFLFLALPYVVTLLILWGNSRQARAPAALGRPYRKA